MEFAAVAGPFLALLFGLMAVGLYFFTTFSLEYSVEQAARLIRTGEAQSTGMTGEQFKARVCSELPVYVDCTNKLRINVQKFTDFADMPLPSCVDNAGALIPPESQTYATGAASEVALVTACYEWDTAALIPFLRLGNMSNGSALIQAATTFRIEPFDNNLSQ